MNVWTVNPHLPAKAGRARISYVEYEPTQNTDIVPSRNWENIRLPIHPRAEFHPLKKGEQFIFVMPEHRGNQYDRDRTQAKVVYFGGTDEEPFLVRLKPDILKNFAELGDQGFFEALKPDHIKRMEIAFGKPAKRQGDFFAVQTPFTWKVLRAMLKLDHSKPAQEPQEKKDSSVGGTRHLFSGLALSVQLPHISATWFCEGTLRAPDHEDLVLKGVFAIEQADNLFDPKNAD